MLIDRKILPPMPCEGATETKKVKPSLPDAYDNYYSRLVKLIPSEIIAFYMALDAIANAMPGKNILLWVMFGISLIGAWFYLKRLANVTGLVQRLLTLLAFAIWVYVIGGPFSQISWYDVNYGKLLLVLYTFFVPVFFKGNVD